MGKVDVSRLAQCIEDARQAALDQSEGPADPSNYALLLKRLKKAGTALPPLYRRAVSEPFVKTLKQLGESGYQRVLRQDPSREGAAQLLFDIAHAILERGESFEPGATDGFQEVASDLYDGFLSAEDRRGIKAADRAVLPPLVKWGSPAAGPYTWPVDATQSFGVEVAIVSLPPANAKRGLLAWAALGHETAGHDILGADAGLKRELTQAVYRALVDAELPESVPRYWADRIDETASDVLGILNMGPAAGIALVGYFRALNAAFGGRPALRCVGPADDPHPADILRGYLASAAVGLLEFADAGEWARVIAGETDKDLARIVLGSTRVDAAVARKSAQTVAAALVKTPMGSLEQHALCDVQNWRDSDERKVKRLRSVLGTAKEQLPRTYARGIYAAHAVAAAVTEAVATGGDSQAVFGRMLATLQAMHDANPAWGPLCVAHRGDLRARPAFVPTSRPNRAGRGRGPRRKAAGM